MNTLNVWLVRINIVVWCVVIVMSIKGCAAIKDEVTPREFDCVAVCEGCERCELDCSVIGQGADIKEFEMGGGP